MGLNHGSEETSDESTQAVEPKTRTGPEGSDVRGQPITVTLTVTNVGTGACPTGILNNSTVLSDNKQPGLTFTGPPVANPAGGWACSLSGGNATCAHPIPMGLPPGYTTTFTIPATVTAPPSAIVTNCAEITNKYDTNSANNRSCVTKQVALLPPLAQ